MPSSRDKSGETSEHPLRRRRQVILVYPCAIWVFWGILSGLRVEPGRTELGTRLIDRAFLVWLIGVPIYLLWARGVV